MTQTLDIAELMEQKREHWKHRAETVKAVARYLDIPQTHLADALGLTRQTVHARLAGASQMEPWELEGFSLALGVPVEVLDMAPNDALRWCLDNPDRIVRTTRSFAEALRVA